MAATRRLSDDGVSPSSSAIRDCGQPSADLACPVQRPRARRHRRDPTTRSTNPRMWLQYALVLLSIVILAVVPWQLTLTSGRRR